ncbi:hypothetical protein [Halosolutus halophilus]|uniref:hypothetical protein n=1 Tax=Halosolutus halophilus TaxID=1552990 RepID=UPI0022352EC3|nr:hypothetical protein [Halosolutus halophilus]
MDLSDFVFVPEPTEQRLGQRQLVDYRSEREVCLRWLLSFGKNPETAEGYADVRCVPCQIGSRGSTDRGARIGLPSG